MKIKQLQYMAAVRQRNGIKVRISHNGGPFSAAIKYIPDNKICKWVVSVYDTELDLTFASGKQAAFKHEADAVVYAQSRFEEFVIKNFFED